MFSSSAFCGGMGVTSSEKCCCSQILTTWGFPSSVIVKSLAVSPPMKVPFLSFTTTCSTTSCEFKVSLNVSVWPGVELPPSCCANVLLRNVAIKHSVPSALKCTGSSPYKTPTEKQWALAPEGVLKGHDCS